MKLNTCGRLLVPLFLLSGCSAVGSSEEKLAQAGFSTRCHAPGVVRCFGFDTPQEIGPYTYPVPGTSRRPEVDVTTKASGSGSLRFTIPPRTGANTSGLFMFNFADDLSVQFGEGDELYIQWRQRFSPELVTTYYENGLGWKQLILEEGDRANFTSPGCTQLELVVANLKQHGFPQMYHSCGGKDGQFESLFQKYGKVMLTPYHTSKSETEQHPTAYTWYDELIVSTSQIADPL